MRLDTYIRKLARSQYWQSIYRASKENSGINIFENRNNFSSIQYIFLYWLRVYNIIYDDLYSKDYPYLDEKVINDDMRCDAYLYHKQSKQEEELRERKLESRKNRKKKGKSSFKIYKGPLNKGDQ